MAVVTIITKNNDGAGVVPSPGSLVEGELAVNTTDRKLYTLNNAGSVVLLASGTSYSDPVVIDVSSASPAVRITQRGAGYALLVEDSANPDSTPFAIDATGNVGIGTTSITEKLTVSGNTSITGALTATADSSFTSTGALLISKGTSGEQPGSPATGMIRYNTSTSQFEGYSGSSPAWKSIGGSTLSNDTSTASNLFPVFAGATSGTAESLFTSNAKLLYKPSTGEFSASIPRASNGIFASSATITASYTVATGDNAMSPGVITIANGVTVTVSDGSRWTVV
jgi:hypothetical protein